MTRVARLRYPSALSLPRSANFQHGRMPMSTKQAALVLGAGGFIGGHLVKRLKREGFWVRGVDIKLNPFAETQADDFAVMDLRDPNNCRQAIDRPFDEVYQLAADMGGA